MLKDISNILGTEKIQGYVNNNTPYNSQKALKFDTKNKGI